jgi:transcriptional antiterminator RfaH
MDYWHESNWYAIHTKPYREAVAAMNIGRLGLEVLLPRIKQEKVVWGVTKIVAKPMFPSYLFARFCPAKYLHLIRYARGVRQVVSSGKYLLPVTEEIIDAIQSRIDQEGYVNLDESPRRGDKVIIKEGPLQGLRGLFERELDDRQRVVILLETIEYQARVLIEKRYLKAAAETF